MTWGPRLEFLLEMAADGEDVPALNSRPRLNDRQVLFMDIFEDLSGSRSATMGGPRGIPISEIHSYCLLMGLAGADFRQTLVRYLRRMDGKYLEVWKRQHEERSGTKGK